MKTSKLTLTIIALIVLVLLAVILIIKKGENSHSTPQVPPEPALTQNSAIEDISGTKLLGRVTLSDNGTVKLKLTETNVAIGAAERFQNTAESQNEPFTVFVIYGAVDTNVAMLNGGWAVWENASADFISEQIDAEIAELKNNHPGEIAARGYRVVECREQVESCTTILEGD
jgi:hypothetical protein